MSKTLQERLGDAQSVLDHVHAALGRHPAGLPQEVETAFRVLVDYRTDIDHWLGMLEARAAARQLLDALETQADADDCVPLGAAPRKIPARAVHRSPGVRHDELGTRGQDHRDGRPHLVHSRGGAEQREACGTRLSFRQQRQDQDDDRCGPLRVRATGLRMANRPFLRD